MVMKDLTNKKIETIYDFLSQFVPLGIKALVTQKQYDTLNERSLKISKEYNNHITSKLTIDF